MRLKYRFLDDEHEISPVQRGAAITLAVGERSCTVSDYQIDEVLQRFVIDNRKHSAYIARDGDNIFVHLAGEVWHVQAINPIDAAGIGGGGSDTVVAPMPGVVVSAPVSVGENVAAGQTLIVIESMKLQTSIVADRDGIIAEIFHLQDETFDKGAELIRFEATENELADEAD